MPTALYQECRKRYDALRHQKIGDHGQEKNGRIIKEGDIIGAFLGADRFEPVMTLLTDANPAREVLTLNIPSKADEVHVYADPSQWPHKKEIAGATAVEVRRFLEQIDQRRVGQRRRNRIRRTR